jgi:hypothetical protein
MTGAQPVKFQISNEWAVMINIGVFIAFSFEARNVTTKT